MTWDDAACIGMDPEIFFPDPRGGNVRGTGRDAVTYAYPRRICAGCTIREQCLQNAMETREMHGMFGGLTPDERVALRRAGKKGTPIDLTQVRAPNKRAIPADIVEERLQMWEDGKSDVDIGLRQGYSPDAIRSWRREYNLPSKWVQGRRSAG